MLQQQAAACCDGGIAGLLRQDLCGAERGQRVMPVFRAYRRVGEAG
jgi:hypothetical protein